MYKIILAQDAHPNKHPFSIKLFPLDQPSDGAPFGTSGRRILIPAQVAERYLPTLEGMAVNYREDLAGHNSAQKVGVITRTRVEDGWAIADGHFYAHDAPEIVQKFHALSAAGDLGASLESTHTFASEAGDGVLTVASLVFTGATVMLREAAAWKSTSVAAQDQSHEVPRSMPDETKTPAAETKVEVKDVAASDALTALVAKLAEGQSAIVAAVSALTEKLGTVQAAAAPATPAEPAKPAAAPRDTALAEMSKKIEELTATVTAAEDKAKKNPAAPQRRTFGPTSVLAKYNIEASEETAATDVYATINKLRAEGVLSVEQSLAAKMEARAKGLVVSE